MSKGTARAARSTRSPFPVDAAVAARIGSLANIEPAFTEAVLASVAPDDRALVPASSVRRLIATFDLRSPREASLLALPAATTLAHPPVSGYRVGAVGLTDDGVMILGGNLEFPGASIHHTIHAEGFVTLRARTHARSLAQLALRQARPCAHCRQVLAEMSWADGLRIIDAAGTDLSLGDLYPWAFVPADLGEPGAASGGGGRGRVPADAGALPADVAGAISRAADRAHAPYSGEPAVIAMRDAGGRIVDGAVLESVAFNPTIGPLQDALAAMVARGSPAHGITEAWLVVASGGRIDHAGPTRDLLRAVAPDARLHVTYWS